MHDDNLAEQVDRLERRFERLLDFILEDHSAMCCCEYNVNEKGKLDGLHAMVAEGGEGAEWGARQLEALAPVVAKGREQERRGT